MSIILLALFTSLNTQDTSSSSSASVGLGMTCSEGSDAACTVFNADYCCMYSWYQYPGQDKVKSYTCEYNPSLESS